MQRRRRAKIDRRLGQNWTNHISFPQRRPNELHRDRKPDVVDFMQSAAIQRGSARQGESLQPVPGTPGMARSRGIPVSRNSIRLELVTTMDRVSSLFPARKMSRI